MRLGRQAAVDSGLFHFLAVLVGAREEEHSLSLETVIAGERVGGNGGIGMADMRHVVHVIDGSRNVEFFWTYFQGEDIIGCHGHTM